jgi:hypothetical protein
MQPDASPLHDRREAARYLAAVAALWISLAAFVWAMAGGPGYLFLAVLVVAALSWYFRYLAQRAQRAVIARDYAVGFRVEGRVLAYALGSLTGDAVRLLR